MISQVFEDALDDAEVISLPPENNNTSVIKPKSGSKKFRPKLLPKKIKTRIASRQQQDDKNSEQAVVPLGKFICLFGNYTLLTLK